MMLNLFGFVTELRRVLLVLLPIDCAPEMKISVSCAVHPDQPRAPSVDRRDPA
jgi:hypothetical protein